MEQAAEAAAAAAGGVFSTSALFPLEVIKINLQARRKDVMSAKYASDVEDKEQELTRAPTENAVVGEEGLQGRTVSQPGQKGVGEKVGGKRLVRKSEGKHRSLSMLSVAHDVYSREGCPGFYRGMCYASSQSGVEKAAYFYGYGWLKALALRIGGGRELNTVTDLMLGYLAEALHLPLTIPIEVVLTKIVTSAEKTNAFAVIQGILEQSGPSGFYKGIRAYVVLCLKPAIQYAIFNRLKALTLAYRQRTRVSDGSAKLTAVQAFVIGAISRAIATVVVFPYIRAKVIMMSRAGAAGGGEKSTSIFSSLLTILKEDGVLALYQGMTPEITRGVLSSALMLMVKEKIHSTVMGTIMGERK